MSPRPLPPQPSLEHLRKQAKALLKAHKARDPDIAARLKEWLPPFSESAESDILDAKVSLRDAQMAIAREYGFENWAGLRKHVAALEKAGMLEMEVDGLRSSIADDKKVVVLRTGDSSRYLPIWIGASEAESIAIKLRDVSIPRPLTHDLLESTIVDLGASVVRVVITDLRDETFYASIVLRLNGGTIQKDSRPK